VSYFRHGDPLDDFDRIDQELARREARLPVCEKCKHRIYDDYYFEIDGEILCEECMKNRYQRRTEDYANGYE
jgi:formylmethanofuran dehydrogenase subunit E